MYETVLYCNKYGFVHIFYRRIVMQIELSEHFTYSKLLRFTFPSIVMMVLTSIYGVVDGFFISNYIGAEPFAAINIIMPAIMIFGAVGFMIGTGGSALVAYTLGAGDRKKANEIFSLLVYLLIVLGLLFTVAGEIFVESISRLLGANAQMLPYCVRYGRVLMLALVPFMLQNVFQSFLVTAERPKLGLYTTLVSGISNIVLDALFIAVFRWGVTGAAAATGLSQVIGGIVPLTFFITSRDSKLRLGKTHMDIRAIAKSCSNGASEFMTNISMSVVNMLYNWQLMRMLGTNGVAAYGVIMYVNFIFLSIYIGYSMGSAPIVGYHYGAGNKDELKNLLGKNIRLILGMSVIITVAAEFLARPLSMIFVSYDVELLEMTVYAFSVYSISFLVSGINIYASSFFTALNDGITSAVISFCRTLIFEVLAVLTLPVIFGSYGIWYAVLAAEIFALLMSVFFLLRKRKKYGYI